VTGEETRWIKIQSLVLQEEEEEEEEKRCMSKRCEISIAGRKVDLASFLRADLQIANDRIKLNSQELLRRYRFVFFAALDQSCRL